MSDIKISDYDHLHTQRLIHHHIKNTLRLLKPELNMSFISCHNGLNKSCKDCDIFWREPYTSKKFGWVNPRDYCKECTPLSYHKATNLITDEIVFGKTITRILAKQLKNIQDLFYFKKMIKKSLTPDYYKQLKLNREHKIYKTNLNDPSDYRLKNSYTMETPVNLKSTLSFLFEYMHKFDKGEINEQQLNVVCKAVSAVNNCYNTTIKECIILANEATAKHYRNLDVKLFDSLPIHNIEE